MKIAVNPRTVTIWLLIMVATLTSANIAVQILRFALGYEHILGFYRILDVNSEGNLPTFYSAVALLIASALLAIIALNMTRSKDRFRFHWAVLSGIFVFLAVDEAVQLHEIIVIVSHSAFQLDGILFFFWVVPYGIFTLILAITYLKFLLALPAKTMRLFVVSAVVFLTGAVGMEMVSSVVVSSLGGWDEGFYHLNHVLVYSVEETLEMVGIVIFIYALLDYLAESPTVKGSSVIFSRS